MGMQMKKTTPPCEALLRLICCVLLLLQYSSYAASQGGSNALSLSCGSANPERDADGRTWEPDSKYIVSGDKSNVRTAEYQDPSLPSNVPYMNARIFTSETSYEFPIQDTTTNPRILLRLRFYPSSYPQFDASKSFFFVSAGGVTLLNNFSASITAEALSQSYIVKEYFLAASSEMSKLRVVFKPSDKYNLSFAFVNGIEVIASPGVFKEEAILVGTSSFGEDYQAIPVNEKSMQTMFRLNVGGNYIAPSNDSGNLMRSWYDDTPYVFGGALGVTLTTNLAFEYRKFPPYIAPVDVYKSWRSMGPDPNVNRQYNLTWVFHVEGNFSYIVRFHWCDFDAVKLNQRVFNVYINNQTAQRAVDVFAFAQRRGAPVKKDYMIFMKDTAGDDELRVDLHPAIEHQPQWFDSILNGLEIFKLSDSASNLAGPNPVISDMMKKNMQADQQQESKPFPEKKSDSSSTAILGGAAGGAAAIGVAAALLCVAINRKRKALGSSDSSWLPIYGNSNNVGSKSNTFGKSQGGSSTISSDAACNCRHFTLAEIKQATKNFDEFNVIGVGGFGKVYRGIIDGDTKVAIKRSNPSSEQGVHEFQTEIEMLSKLRHRHLVSLMGYCEEGNEMVLVYDYMGRGTLREHLYKGNKIVLSWKQRLEICIGAARGLHYLHTGAKYTIIHRDVKTTNILLDDKWVAKVSDFGLSKTGPNMNQGHVSTVVKGSFGYLDPEYFRRQQLTEKSDVYSFGVVLFEVICARPALNASLPKEQVSLADWALRCQSKGCLQDIIDPQLEGKITPECLKNFGETAEKCLSDHGTDRPSMGDVLWNLEFALQLQENPSAASPSSGQLGIKKEGDDDDDDVEEEIDHKKLLAMHRNTLSLGSEMDDHDASSDIFSQFVSPEGR